jgi:hypothetical protein
MTATVWQMDPSDRLQLVELGRLMIILQAPLRYVERRVEDLRLVDDHHYAVTITQQLKIPSHLPGEGAKPKPSMLIPLGWFTKDRLPDIKIAGPDGSAAALLRRAEQGQVVSTLFTSQWRTVFFEALPEELEDDDPARVEADTTWELIQSDVERIITSERLGAYAVIIRLSEFLTTKRDEGQISAGLAWGLTRLLEEDEFWIMLSALAEARLLVARMDARPDTTMVVTASYTERFAYRGYAHEYARSRLRQILAWVGIIGLPISRPVANRGHAASLWIIHEVPDGLEPVRCFLQSSANTPEPAEMVTVDSRRAAVGQHIDAHAEFARPKQDNVLLDVQIAPSTAVTSTIALASLLFLVSVFVYKTLPHLSRGGSSGSYGTTLLGLGALFAAAPAAIAGALAYRGHTFVRYVSRGPRVLVGTLSGLAVVLAVLITLHPAGGLSEVIAFSLSVYSLIVMGIFLIIRWAPRWRKGERSRRRAVTDKASPARCRKMQAWYVSGCLAIWTVTVVIAAKSEADLQRINVLSKSFPNALLHVWKHWLGV